MDVFAVKLGSKEVAGWQAFHLRRDPPATTELFYCFWVVAAGNKVVLVDTGFRSDVARRRGIVDYVAPERGLEVLGISKADITDVILTHLHYDHAGLVDDYGSSMVHVDAREIAFYCGPAMRVAEVRRSIEAADVAATVRAVAEGRLAARDCEIVPGVSLHHVGGHSPGMQVVQVDTGSDTFVLASDAAHFYESITRRSPYPVFHEFLATYAAFDAVLALSGDLEHVIPGHDPEVFRRFRSPSDRAAGVAVRVA